MNDALLTIDERSNIDSGSWFSKLPPPLRAEILACAVVRRIADGAVRIEPTRLVVLSRDKLLAIAER